MSFQQSQISDIIPAILSAEVVIAASNDWRLQEEIITHFVCFQHLTNSENIYHKIIPVLLIKLKRAVSCHIHFFYFSFAGLKIVKIVIVKYFYSFCFCNIDMS